MSQEEDKSLFNWPMWIGLVVDDLEAQRRYYRDVLGLSERRAGPGYIMFKVGLKKFELLLAQASRPQYAHRGFHIGFSVASIEAARAELLARGLEPVGDIERDGKSAWCYFQDPEGNFYQIAEEETFPE